MSVVTATILSEGAAIDGVYELIAIDIRREVNRVPYANLVLVDGDAAKREFPLSDGAYFQPGKEIEVQLRYEGETEDATFFKGPVIRHGIEANVHGSLLRIEIQDAAIKLTRARKSRVFVEQSDSEAIDKVIKEAGLKVGTIDPTETKHPQIVQYYCSDWDFIVSRSDTNGLLAVADDGEVSLRKIDLSAAPAHKFDFGISEIYDFEFELDAGNQHSKVTSRGWDVAEQQSSAVVEAESFALSQGNLDGAELADAVGFGPCVLSHPVPMAQEELKAWADARMTRMRMSMIRGRLAAPGIPDIRLLDVMEIAGVGQRFNGKTLVTGVRHRVDTDGWRTDVQFGLSAQSFSRAEGIQDTPAAGLLPAVGGLQIGVVTEFEADTKDGGPRVKVMLPGIDAQDQSVWARLAAPDAGKGRGVIFHPEVADEVVVGFFNQDPRQAVILGGLCSSKNSLPEEFAVTEKNLKKGIITRGGTKIVFNDEDDKASLYFETKSSNKILLDEDKKLVEISDQHGNKITLDENGIKLESVKDLKLKADGNVQIEGAKVDVK